MCPKGRKPLHSSNTLTYFLSQLKANTCLMTTFVAAYLTIPTFPDEVLLEIFDFYRQAPIGTCRKCLMPCYCVHDAGVPYESRQLVNWARASRGL